MYNIKFSCSPSPRPAAGMVTKKPACAPLTEANVRGLDQCITNARKNLEEGKITQQEFCDIMKRSEGKSGDAMKLWKRFEYARSKDAEAQDREIRLREGREEEDG